MKRIIITGAGGLVATELIFTLLNRSDAHLYLISTHEEVIRERYAKYKDRVDCFTLQSFTKYVINTDHSYDYCIHTAFSRSSNGNQIVESINYQRSLLTILKEKKLGIFVNISSQSVYGKMSDPLWKENTPLDPDYLYAMGKFCSEVITQEMLSGTNIRWTNIRLCSVCENARFIRVFVQNAIKGIPIVLTAPDQQCSFIAVQDVANALFAFINQADKLKFLAPIYNLGSNLVNTIEEIAYIVKSVAEEYSLPVVDILKESATNVESHVGMDSSLFMQTFSWTPMRDMKIMVKNMFEM